MVPAKGPVTRADIERKLAEIRGVTEARPRSQDATRTGLVVAGVAVVVVAFVSESGGAAKRTTSRSGI
jgi:hypothetical protein